MPKTLDSYLADRALTRQLYLLRFSAGEKKKVLAVLVDMRAELVAKLRAGESSVLSSIASTISRALTQVLTLFSKWAGSDKECTVELNQEFLPPEMTPQELSALVSAWQTGAISMQVLFSCLQKAELIASDLTLEEMQGQIGSEGPRMPDMGVE